MGWLLGASRLLEVGLGGSVLGIFGTPVPACSHALHPPYHAQGVVADSFGQLGERAASVSGLCAQTSASLAASFEAPLKECVRTVGAVKKVMADRSAALQAYQAVSEAEGRAGGAVSGRG